jgi:hypothetical protein
MNTRASWIRGSLLVALVVGLLAVPEAVAKGSRGGRSGGRGARPPRAFAPRMPRAAPARANAPRARARTNTTPAHTNRAAAAATRRATTGNTSRATTASVNPRRTTPSSLSPYTYTYGSGTGARRYRAYGYGYGYRNRSYRSRYGHGRSQGYNRALVARLRSVHASLGRINQDYQGHRLRAMQAIAMGIRQLRHQAMVYRRVGLAAGANNGAAMGKQRGGGAGTGRSQLMSQAQADTRMSQALRTLQGINMQLSSPGYTTTGPTRAAGHVQRAIHELNTALSIP